MLESLSGLILVAFTSFFTLINPLGTMPVFMTMTSELSEKQKRQTATKAVLTAFIALVFFAFSGQLLFNFFGISVHGFRIVGGVGVGVASVIAPMDIAETSPPRIRGRPG